jgi:hypothetical protein
MCAHDVYNVDGVDDIDVVDALTNEDHSQKSCTDSSKEGSVWACVACTFANLITQRFGNVRFAARQARFGISIDQQELQ